MIKRANQKKKKGFSLIELIIVLAVMAIIALIAIPNFSAVRDNSKKKADVQSAETIERTVLMLTADETLKVSTTGSATVVEFTLTYDGTTGAFTGINTPTGGTITAGNDELTAALKEVSKPQKHTNYKISVKPNGEVDVALQ